MSTLFYRRLIVCFLMLVSFGLGTVPYHGSAQSSTSLPLMSSAIFTALPSPSVSVSGHGFTPGGLVMVVLYDQWGQQLYEPRLTIATSTTFGDNGSIDPARGYRPAGSIDEPFDLIQEPTWGPNGSQDPAQGFDPGASVRLGCTAPLMVRAFDQSEQAWSTTLDVRFVC